MVLRGAIVALFVATMAAAPASAVLQFEARFLPSDADPGAVDVAVGDLNGDGKPDVVTAGSAAVSVLWAINFVSQSRPM